MSKMERSYAQDVHQYVQTTSLRLPAYMAELIAETDETPLPMMATSPEQGQFLSFLMKSMGAKRAIEVGVFTGIGTMWMAHAVGDGGLVVACDVSDEFVAVGQPYWEKAGLADRIDVRIAPAQETLAAMAGGGDAASYDFCYIDADKEAYGAYYEMCLDLMRPGGVIALDNMLLGGRVADASITEEPVRSIRALAERLYADDRVDVSFLAIDDGLYLAQKRS